MTETLIQRLRRLGREDGWTTNSLINEAATALEVHEAENAHNYRELCKVRDALEARTQDAIILTKCVERLTRELNVLRPRISELEGALKEIRAVCNPHNMVDESRAVLALRIADAASPPLEDDERCGVPSSGPAIIVPPRQLKPLPDTCAKCGHPKSEHRDAGACYGLCGEFVAKPIPDNPGLSDKLRARNEVWPDTLWLAAATALEASEREKAAKDILLLDLAPQVSRYKELYEAGCKTWEPVYQVVLNERDALRTRISELEGALEKITHEHGWTASKNIQDLARATLRNRENEK